MSDPPEHKMDMDPQEPQLIPSDDSDSGNKPENAKKPENGNESMKRKRPAKRQTKKRKNSSFVWDHFEEIYINGSRKGRCNYCNKVLCADSENNGTSSLGKHIPRCPQNPNAMIDQSTIVTKNGDNGQTSLKTWKFDPVKVRMLLIKMIIVDELPFSFVEHEGFREFMEALCSSFNIPSRWTVARDILDYYLDEKLKLKEFFVKNKQTVSFTTDTWTSNQRVNYMCLTSHFIDDNWVYHKRIINFKPIDSHKGENIATVIKECLDEWGIERVMTFTMDNASCNDVAARELKRRLPNLFSKGKYLHVRCLAHIINLIVQDGLKAQDDIVDCIRNAIKYVRHSPARLSKFKACASEKKVDSKALLSLDVCTRWNSTYDMLERAIKFDKAFDLYARKDSNFRKELRVVPDHYHWDYAKRMASILEVFKRKTVDVSCSTYVVAHELYAEVMDIHDTIDDIYKKSKDRTEFMTMVMSMKYKFDKYFDDKDKKNKLFEFAAILDPRMKLDIIQYNCQKVVELMKDMTEDESEKMVGDMIDDVQAEMQSLITEYETLYQTGSKNPARTENIPKEARSGNCSWRAKFEKARGGGNQSFGNKSELEKYLMDGVEPSDDNFDILQWWKVNSARYPTLSKMAKDIFAVPVSTVASESAFSTGGLVVDPYRSSLSPNIVEALICTQDWIRKGRKEINEFEDIVKDEEFAKDVFERIGKMKIK